MDAESAIDTEITDAQEQDVQEKMLPVSRVNELVKSAKLKGRDAMREEFEQLQQENERLKANQGSMGGMSPPAFDEKALSEKIKADLMQEFQSQREANEEAHFQENLKKTAGEFMGKLSGGQELYPDFSEVIEDFNPAAFPQLVILANETDNTAAIIYELAKNPQKLATIAVLAERDPRAAQSAMNKLSASIKANDEAVAAEKNGANAPLSRLQSSPVGSGSGALDLEGLKRKYTT
jgi:hypothetical protein